jgi:hypothetical protein
MPLYRLKLDHDRIFWGAEPIDVVDMKDSDVVLDHEPDNKPGAYRWDDEVKALMPLPPQKIKAAPDAPTFEQAFRDALRAMDKFGIALPARTAAWCADFDKTIDGGGK